MPPLSVIEPDCPVFLFIVQVVTLLLNQRYYASGFCKDTIYLFVGGVSLCGAFGSNTVPGISTRQTDQTRSVR